MRSRLALAALSVSLAACAMPAAPPAEAPKDAVVRQSASAPRAGTVIEGAVRAPAGIIASGGGNVIAPGGGNVIAPGGGNMIGHDSGSFAGRQLLAVSEQPLAGAEVILADAAGQAVPGLASTRTDARGRYRFERVPSGFTFVVVVKALTAAGEAARLETLTRTGALGATADVDTATTFVSTAVLEDVEELGALNMATFQRAVATTGQHLGEGPLPSLADGAAVSAYMRDLAARVEGLQETVDALRRDMAEVRQRLDQLEAELAKQSPTPAPTATPEGAATARPTPTAAPTATPLPQSAWTVSTLAGAGVEGYLDGQGTAARFNKPRGLYVGLDDMVYVADNNNHMVRRITPQGHVTTVAGLEGKQGKADGAIALATLSGPTDVALDGSGRLFVAESGNRVIRLVADGQVSTVAGKGTVAVDGTGDAAGFLAPRGMAIAPTGLLTVADSSTSAANGLLREVTAAGQVTTRLGAGGGALALPYVRDVALDDAGNVYAVQDMLHRVVKIAPDGQLTVIAGGSQGQADGVGTAAQFNEPMGIARDAQGNLYVADTGNDRLRMIAKDGTVTTIAGSTAGSEDGPGAQARFTNPYDVEVGIDGRLYLTEKGGHRVRVVTRN